MSHLPGGPKQPVSMTLSEDAERAARSLTANLSETVEKLLAEPVEAEQRLREQRERLIDETIEMAKAHYTRHGLWGEKFSTL